MIALSYLVFFITDFPKWSLAEQGISCNYCVETEGLATCESESIPCLPGVTACVSTMVKQSAQSELGTVYWRGCELPEHKDIPDGCTCGDEVDYCKQTCYTDNCNDDESVDFEQVVQSID